jgi:hypothetical protein
MPKGLGLCELSQRLVRDYPTANGISASLLDGSANLRRRAFRKRQQADASGHKDMRTHVFAPMSGGMILSQRRVARPNMANSAIGVWGAYRRC